MIDTVKYKLKLKDKGAPEVSEYDCRRDIEQFIHVASEDNGYHQPYIVRQKLCLQMKDLANSIEDEDLVREVQRLI